MQTEIFTCEQGSPEWFECRRGIPTASMFKTVMASGKGGGESKTRAEYMRKLAGEIVTGLPMENYSNDAMNRGKVMEDAARERYAFENDCEPEQIGFIRLNGVVGCSPDSLIGDRGLLEIKTKAPHLLIDLMFRDDEFIAEHKAQCQGQLWIAQREWIDLGLYYDGLPLVKKSAVRDEPYIANLSGEVDRFNDDLAALVEKVRAYGEPVQALAAA